MNAEENIAVARENAKEQEAPSTDVSKYDKSLDGIFESKGGYHIAVSMTLSGRQGVALNTYFSDSSIKRDALVLVVRNNEYKSDGYRTCKDYCQEELRLGTRYDMDDEEVEAYARGLREVLEGTLDRLYAIGELAGAANIACTLHIHFRAGEAFRSRAKAGQAKYADAFRVETREYKVVLWDKIQF